MCEQKNPGIWKRNICLNFVVIWLIFNFIKRIYIILRNNNKIYIVLPKLFFCLSKNYLFVSRNIPLHGNKSLEDARGLLSRIRLWLSQSFRSGFRKGYHAKSTAPTETNFSARAAYTATLNAYTRDTENIRTIAHQWTKEMHINAHTSIRCNGVVFVILRDRCREIL